MYIYIYLCIYIYIYLNFQTIILNNGAYKFPPNPPKHTQNHIKINQTYQNHPKSPKTIFGSFRVPSWPQDRALSPKIYSPKAIIGPKIEP